LIRMMLVEIDEGRLDEASKNPEYEQEFRKMMDQISRVNPSLVPIEYRVRNTIRFTTGEDDEETVSISSGGFFIEISKKIVDQIVSYQQIFDQQFVKATPSEIPFVKNCEILHYPNLSPEDSMELIIEALNDIIEEHFRKITFLVIINPGTYDVYYANIGWLYGVITGCRNAKGFYEIAKVAEHLPIRVSRFVLANLVRETMRARLGIIVREDVMDFFGIEEKDDSLQ